MYIFANLGVVDLGSVWGGSPSRVQWEWSSVMVDVLLQSSEEEVREGTGSWTSQKPAGGLGSKADMTCLRLIKAVSLGFFGRHAYFQQRTKLGCELWGIKHLVVRRAIKKLNSKKLKKTIYI